jgi:hypothetical protein
VVTAKQSYSIQEKTNNKQIGIMQSSFVSEAQRLSGYISVKGACNESFILTRSNLTAFLRLFINVRSTSPYAITYDQVHRARGNWLQGSGWCTRPLLGSGQSKGLCPSSSRYRTLISDTAHHDVWPQSNSMQQFWIRGGFSKATQFHLSVRMPFTDGA